MKLQIDGRKFGSCAIAQVIPIQCKSINRAMILVRVVHKLLHLHQAKFLNVSQKATKDKRLGESLLLPRLVESRAGIIPRPSLLDPSVRLSPHSAPDSIRLCLCSCVCNRGMTHVEPPDYLVSSCGDFRPYGAGEPAPRM